MPNIVPKAPAVNVILPTVYGAGGNIRENYKYVFSSRGQAGTGVLECPKRVFINGLIQDVIVSANDTGTINNTSISLHKVTSSGVDTILQSFMIEFGNAPFFRLFKCAKVINNTDMIYVQIDSIGVGVKNLVLQLTINSRG